MSSPSAPFSDLELAREVSRRLRSPRVGAAPRSEPSPRYVPFDARRFVPATHWVAAPRGHRFGAELWNELLDGCLSAANAEAAFVMDGQGLVVATRGTMQADDAEAIGARLMVALDQAEEIGGATGSYSVAIEFGGAWLTGLRLQLKDERSLTVGLVARAPLARESRDVIENLMGITTENEI
ncbi:MAG: roadblock/LC7 domain-containing protein [Polyangiaceae bacterium]